MKIDLNGHYNSTIENLILLYFKIKNFKYLSKHINYNNNQLMNKMLNMIQHRNQIINIT